MAHIWRLQNVGIAFETVKGTKEPATGRIPKISGYTKPVVTTLRNESGYGVIEEVYDAQPIKELTETTLEGILSDRISWYFLLWALWSSAITGSWPYTHNFTVLNSNAHPTFTLWWKDSVKSVSSAYNMVSEFTISAVVGEYVNFTANFMGKKMVTESEPTVTYSCSENPFRARDVKVYFSDTEWSRGTAIPVTSLNLTITKNLYDHQTLGSLDIDSIYNQQFSVSWDMELLYEADTYLNFVRAGTKKYTKIEIINTDVTLTPSGNPTMTFILWKTAFETRDQTDDNNEIVKQTLWFTWAYNCSDSYSIKASIINSVATDYDS